MSKYDGLKACSIRIAFQIRPNVRLCFPNKRPKYIVSSFQIGPIHTHFASLAERYFECMLLTLCTWWKSMENMICHMSSDPKLTDLGCMYLA